MQVLRENRHARLTLDPVRKLVTWTRSEIPFDSTAEWEAEVAAYGRALVRIDRPSHAILLDVRAAPLRNDPDFEAVSVRFRRDIPKEFRRAAVLLRTQVGRLQIVRHAKEHGAGPVPFLDAEAALAYLLGPGGG